MLLQDFKSKPGFLLLTGSEIVADSAILAGGPDGLCQVGNAVPVGYVRLYEAASQGRWDRGPCRAGTFDRIVPDGVLERATPEAGGAAGVGSFKVALKHMGIFENGDMRRPNLRFRKMSVPALPTI